MANKDIEKFNIELKIGDKTFKSSNIDLYKAFDDLAEQIENPVLTTKGVITVKKGKMERERFFYPLELKRFIRNPLSRSMWTKVIYKL